MHNCTSYNYPRLLDFPATVKNEDCSGITGEVASTRRRLVAGRGDVAGEVEEDLTLLLARS